METGTRIRIRVTREDYYARVLDEATECVDLGGEEDALRIYERLVRQLQADGRELRSIVEMRRLAAEEQAPGSGAEA